MPADTSILMGFRGPQIESQDVHNARAAQMMQAQQQNILAQMQMGEMARATQQKNKMRDILSKAPEGAPDSEINRLIEKAYIGAGDISGLITHRKTLAEAEAAQAKVGKEKAQTSLAEQQTAASKYKLDKERTDHGWEAIGNARNPAEYKEKIYDALSKKLISQTEADSGLARLEQIELQDRIAGGGNANYNKFRMDNLTQLLSLKDQLARKEVKPEKLDTGETIEFRDLNPNSPTFGKVVGPEPITKAMTPAQKELAEYHKGLLANAKRRLNEETSAGKSITPQTLDFLAQVYAQTGKMPELGSGKNAANLKTAVLERAAQITMGGGVNAADAATTVLNNKAERAGELSGQRAVGTQIANIQVAANEATKMINIARPYVDKVNPSDYPTLNAVGNYVASKTGDPNITGLTTALNSLVNIYARAINPKGVATVSDKNHAREIINTAMAKGQINEAFKVMQAEMDAALASGPETKTAMRRPPSAVAPTGAVDKNNKWLK